MQSKKCKILINGQFVAEAPSKKMAKLALRYLQDTTPILKDATLVSYYAGSFYVYEFLIHFEDES